eukprot:jgi/Tetstr1/442895/TSEL_030958.t1
MAVPAPPMSRATSSQHPATTASATADGAVAGGDALPGDDDAPGAPRQEAEEAVVEATDRAEGVVEASEAALAPPAPQPPAGHADLLVAMLTGALRAVAGGGHMHYHVRVLAGRPSCVDCGQRTDWECCCDGTPALCGPKYPSMHGDPSAGSPLPDHGHGEGGVPPCQGRVPRRDSRRRV